MANGAIKNRFMVGILADGEFTLQEAEAMAQAADELGELILDKFGEILKAYTRRVRAKHRAELVDEIILDLSTSNGAFSSKSNVIAKVRLHKPKSS